MKTTFHVRLPIFAVAGVVAASSLLLFAEEPPVIALGGAAAAALKSEHFDKDPGWEGIDNRIVPKVIPTAQQDFGYSPTNFAGKASGEIGGKITRGSRLAYYATKLPTRT